MIPIQHLSKIGFYSSVTVQGVAVKVNVVDNATLAEQHIDSLMKSILEPKPGHETQSFVVGVDVKTLTYTSTTSPHVTTSCNTLVLCAGAQCLIIYLASIPKLLRNFLEDSRICFVRGPHIHLPSYLEVCNVGVELGDLAARVLRKPRLTKLRLADIAKEVKVKVKVPYTGAVSVDGTNPKVLIDDQVKLLVSDAVAYYQISYKLLSTLQMNMTVVQPRREGLGSIFRSRFRWFWLLLILVLISGSANSSVHQARSTKY